MSRIDVRIYAVEIPMPKDANVIIGRSHFIKTVEDIHEALVNTVPGIRYGLAFLEASGKRLIRFDGNDEELVEAAIEAAKRIAGGHYFVLYIRNAYPINVLERLRHVPEVVELLAATANPVQVIIGETGQGRAILGIVDGYPPLGVETEEDKRERHEFLRRIGYKK